MEETISRFIDMLYVSGFSIYFDLYVYFDLNVSRYSRFIDMLYVSARHLAKAAGKIMPLHCLRKHMQINDPIF